MSLKLSSWSSIWCVITSCFKMDVGPYFHLCSVSLLVCLVKVIDIFWWGNSFFLLPCLSLFPLRSSIGCVFLEKRRPSSFPGNEGHSYCLFSQTTDNYVAVVSKVPANQPQEILGSSRLIFSRIPSRIISIVCLYSSLSTGSSADSCWGQKSLKSSWKIHIWLL